MKKLNYQIKEQMVQLAGACFWFWASFHSFLSTCGVSRQLIKRYPKETFNKYTVMRNILERLDEAGQIDVIQNVVSGFYRLTGPIDKDNLDVGRAKRLLAEFRELVGNDPIERAVEEQQIMKFPRFSGHQEKLGYISFRRCCNDRRWRTSSVRPSFQA